MYVCTYACMHVCRYACMYACMHVYMYACKVCHVYTHACIHNTRIVVTFTPPDGEFELMKYRTSENIHVPFKVFPIVKEHGRTRVEVAVTVKSLYPANLFALRLIVKVCTHAYIYIYMCVCVWMDR